MNDWQLPPGAASVPEQLPTSSGLLGRLTDSSVMPVSLARKRFDSPAEMAR